MNLKGHNALWSGMFQAISGHILEMVRDRSRVAKLIIDVKSNIGFQMKWKSSILGELEGHWQPVRSAILVMGGLLVSSALYVMLCWKTFFWLIVDFHEISYGSTSQAPFCVGIRFCSCFICHWFTTVYIVDRLIDH